MKFELISTSLFVSLIWSFTPLIQKYVLLTLPPETFMVLASILSVVIINLFVLTLRGSVVRQSLRRVRPIHIFLISLMIVMGAVVSRYLYLYLLQHHESYLVISLTNLSPLFVTVFAMVLFKEQVTVKAALGVLLTCVGVILLINRK